MNEEQRIWGRGWYFENVVVDPKDPDKVYVSNTSVYRSDDGGKTFSGRVTDSSACTIFTLRRVGAATATR